MTTFPRTIPGADIEATNKGTGWLDDGTAVEVMEGEGVAVDAGPGDVVGIFAVATGIRCAKVVGGTAAGVATEIVGEYVMMGDVLPLL